MSEHFNPFDFLTDEELDFEAQIYEAVGGGSSSQIKIVPAYQSENVEEATKMLEEAKEKYKDNILLYEIDTGSCFLIFGDHTDKTGVILNYEKSYYH